MNMADYRIQVRALARAGAAGYWCRGRDVRGAVLPV